MFLKDFSGLFRLLLFPVKQLLLLAESLVDVPKFINGEQSIPPRECTGEVVFSWSSLIILEADFYYWLRDKKFTCRFKLVEFPMAPASKGLFIIRYAFPKFATGWWASMIPLRTILFPFWLVVVAVVKVVLAIDSLWALLVVLWSSLSTHHRLRLLRHGFWNLLMDLLDVRDLSLDVSILLLEISW